MSEDQKIIQRVGNLAVGQGDISGGALVIFTSVLLVAGYNFSFFIHIAKAYPVTLSNIAFLVSLVIFIAAGIVLLLTPFCYKYTIKPVLILLLMSSLAAYFMDSYNLVIDSTMVNSIIHTNIKAALKENVLDVLRHEEINNAYDNAILYTDYFLSKVISLLKENDNEFEIAMFYISDHGESLGENSLYLHGLPYLISPDTQKHIPAVLWLGEHYKIDKNNIKRVKDNKFSHDNVFHTLLGLFEVESKVYNINMDIIHKR